MVHFVKSVPGLAELFVHKNASNAVVIYFLLSKVK